MKTLALEQIRRILSRIDILPEIERGFLDYSEGRVVVPPVGEMILEHGEVHIKYGFVRGDEYYVIKIASGFYGNPALGLPSGNGLMLLFSQRTGELVCTLHDEGYLTNIRTAAAGAVVAKYLAPPEVDQIGIIGAGTQARLQPLFLRGIVDCNRIMVWGTNQHKLDRYREEMEQEGFQVNTTLDATRVMMGCNLIITATPSRTPLLRAADLAKGTHITAVGSDTIEKQELDPMILRKADLVVADSLAQCMERGEIFQAVKAGAIRREDVVELGRIISGHERGRSSGSEISVADLTGVAVQDLNIATVVYRALES